MGPPFYNQVNVPIGLVLLALIGIGPVIAWRRATWANLRKNFQIPTIIALITAGVLFPFVPLSGRSEIFTYATFILCAFVMTCILREFLNGARARMGLEDGGNFVSELGTLTWRNKRRYGGYIVHIGTVLIFRRHSRVAVV